MSRKFYKLLIIGNTQPTTLHIPNRNNGIMECWNNEIKRWGKVNDCSPQLPSFPLFNFLVSYFPSFQLPSFRRRRLKTARRALSHYSIIPPFHHSRCERSEPKC